MFNLDHFSQELSSSLEAREEQMGASIDAVTREDIARRCQASKELLAVDCSRKGSVARFINHASSGSKNSNCASSPAVTKRNHSTLFYRYFRLLPTPIATRP